MLDIEIDRDTFANLVKVTSGAVAKNTTKPALRCVKISAHRDELRASATDCEIGVSAVVASGFAVKSPGVCLIPAATLADILRVGGDGSIRIRVDKQIELKTGKASYKVPVEDVDTFPDSQADYEGGERFGIEGRVFKSILRQAGHAAGDDSGRKYASSGVLVEVIENTINAVATDTLRLSVASGRTTTPANCSGILAAKTVSQIQAAFSDEDILTVTIRKNTVTVFSGGVTLNSPLLTDKMMPWQKIFDKNKLAGGEITDDPRSLLGVLRRVTVTVDDESPAVVWGFTEKNLALSASCKSGESETEHTVAAHAGNTDTVEVRLPADQLSEFFSLAASEGFNAVSIVYQDANSPIYLKAGEQWKTLVMCMKQRDEK